jgi:methionine--tRNA ligase beta chain
LAEVREANRAFQEARPWDAPEADRRRALYEALWLLKAAAVWLGPVLPFSSAQVFRMLGYAEAPKTGDWEQALQPVAAGQALGEVRPLFPRAESKAEKVPAPLAGAGPSAEKRRIPLEIRAARVKDVRPHPSADRLYVLSLELGPGEERTVVAGMRPYYTVDQLTGRMVAVLTNLQPRTIRKVASEGMVLAAEAGDRVALLRIPDGVAAGDRIGPSGGPIGPISIDEFASTPVIVGHVRGTADGGRLRLDVGNGEVTVAGQAAVGSAVVVRLGDGPDSTAEMLGFGGDRPLMADDSLPSGSRVR